jgi:transposase
LEVSNSGQGILSDFLGTLIHDGWKPYRDLLCKHGLCNAHHLQELIYLFKELEQIWAGRMIELLVAACHEMNEAGGSLSVARVADFRTRYAEILSEGDTANPWVPQSGKRGCRAGGAHAEGQAENFRRLQN